ncbi:LIM domain only protein 7-like isoform X7 [Sander vitreus]
MEWRQQSTVSYDEAYLEAQRWIEAVTKKTFGSDDFRSALENGVLLCDLINKIKPGIIKRVNRLPTPIAGLDNLNVFLKACGKLGLKEAQLFHPGDLQDLSTRVTVKHQETNRRLKNVLITIYWLGRRAQCERFYDGPYLNFKAFEGLLGTALYKALQESSSQKGSNVRDSGFGDSWYSEREELFHLRGGGGGGGHRRDDSLDSLESLGSRPQSISSETTLKGSSEGCCSDTEADSVFRMAENKDSLSYRRSVTITPKASSQFNQFLPTKDKASGYVPAPLRKKRAERNEDSRRSWANPTYTEDEGTLTRQHQMQESIDGSKSTSDIQIDPTVIQQVRYEELQKYRERIKSTEDKWQDDLSKWKNRRRSVNSDIVKKKEEREKIEEITYSSNRRSKTFKEMQEERENKGKNSIGGRLASLSYLDDEDIFDTPVITPRTRTFPARSYTIDTPYYSSEPLDPSQKEAEPPAASPATGRASSPPTSMEVDIVDSPAGSDTTTTITSNITPTSCSFFHSSQSPAAAAPLQRSPVSERTGTVKTEETTTTVSSSSSLQKVPEPRPSLLLTQTEVGAPSSGSLYKQQPQPSSMEHKPPGVSRVSASLPRSYQRSDSTRLTSVIAPRPFRTQSSRLTSLPRAATTDDSQKRVNGDATVSKKSSVPSRYHQFMTSEDETRSQSSSAHSSEEEEEEEEEKEDKTTAKSITSTQSVSPVPPQIKSEAPVSAAPAKETSQENYCEMRISLNQKPNSSRDFGFQAAWDSTGARITSIQLGSPAEMCQLQVGDEVLTVNGHQVAEMSYPDWKSCMEEALQEGSLIMDIRHHGKNRGSESAMPDIPVPSIIPSSSRWSWDPEEERKRQEKWQKEQERLLQEKYKRDQEKLQEEWMKAQQEVAESVRQEESGSLEVIRHSISPLPSLSTINQPTSPPWEEEERKRKEEQERQKQAEERERQRQAEERRKREEEERELQRLQEERERKERQEEEERKMREEEELRWQRRREEERKEERRRQEAAEQQRRERERAFEQQQQWADGSHGFANVQSSLCLADRTKSKSSPQLDEEKPQRKGVYVQPGGMAHWLLEEQLRSAGDKRAQSQWAASELETERRNILNAMRYREPERVTDSTLGDKRSQQSVSQAEQERQQILNEMKKKTPLLMDKSWIRERSSNTTTIQQSDVPPMRRGESLDNLDASYNSWRSSWTPRSNSHIPNYTRPHSALSGSTSFYGGGLGAQRPGSSTLPSSSSMGSLRGGAGTPSSPWSRQSLSPSPSSPSPTTSPEPTSSEAGAPEQRSRSVSGRKICTFCDTALGKGAAMIIESLGLCYHLGCFKCIDCKSDLGGSEAGAEVRIRNKQLYCNTCYMRFKAAQPTSM